MPICEGCGSSFEQKYQYCPYCGREKPVPPQAKTGASPVSELACPYCHIPDKVEKVQALIKHQTRTTQGKIPVGHVYSDQDGKIHTSTSYKDFSSVEISPLLLSLQPPVKPIAPGKPQLTSSVVFFILFVLCSLLTMYGISTTNFVFFGGHDYSFTGTHFFLLLSAFFAFLALISIILYKEAGKSFPDRLKEARTAILNWEKAMQHWENLYYCYRDGRVFLPGKNDSAPIDEMRDFLYSVKE